MERFDIILAVRYDTWWSDEYPSAVVPGACIIPPAIISGKPPGPQYQNRSISILRVVSEGVDRKRNMIWAARPENSKTFVGIKG